MRARWGLGGIALAVVVAVAVFTFERERRMEAAPSGPRFPSSVAPEAADSILLPTAEDPVEPADDVARRLPVPAAPDAASTGGAIVAVRAVLAGTSTPLAEITIGFYRGDVTLTAPALSEEWYEEISRSNAAFSKEYRTLSGCVTDATGIVELSVPAGKAFTIQASSDDPSVAKTRLDVPALADRERREVTIEIARGDRVFLGRVVEREGEAPIRSAVVTLVDNQENELARTESDASGGFSFQVAEFTSYWTVHIEAPGFAVALGELDEGHEQPGREAVFRLSRGAALFGRVTLADGTASPGSIVLALCKRAHLKQPAEVPLFWGDDKEFSQVAVTDDAGSYRLEGLPPSIRLEIGAFVEDESVCSDLAAITLAPGEEREVSMVLAAGPFVDVLVIDEQGAPVPHLDLWLAKESWFSTGLTTPRYFDADEDPEGELTSDEAGRCRIDSILKGPWFLGPAPAESQTGFGTWFSFGAKRSADEKRLYPGIGQPILVQSGEQEITLTLQRGRTIEGQVVDPKGQAIPSTLIECRSDVYGWVPGARTGSDGTFRTDLLAEGEYSLTASGSGSLGDSRPLAVRAGERNVVLALVAHETYSVSGVVSGFENSDRVGLRACPRSRPHWMTSANVSAEGEFEFDELEPGIYDISAEYGDAFAQVVGLDVGPGLEGQRLNLELRLGGRLLVRCAPTRMAGIEVYRDGILVTVSLAVDGTSPTIVVPAGELEVRLFPDVSLADEDWGAPASTKIVSVQPGSEQEIVFP